MMASGQRRTSNASEAISLARQETGGFSGRHDRLQPGEEAEEGERVRRMPTGELVYPGLGTKASPYVVSFAPNDPQKQNPLEFSTAKKYTITMMTALATLCIAYCSSAFAGAISAMLSYFGVSRELLTAGLSLYVLGFALGPLVWAPLSELFGRRKLFLATYAPFTFFHIGCALAKNIETLLVCRFFAGMFGSAPLTNSGGVISDMFIPRDRSLAMSFFAMAPFSGPVLGPIVAGFVGQTVGWRANFWIMFGFSAVMFMANFLLVPETYAPAILRERAAKLMEKANAGRKAKDLKVAARLSIDKEKEKEKDGLDALDEEAGDIVYYVSIYDKDKPPESLGHKLQISLVRPFKMLLLDVIVLLFALYAALVYGILYLCFTAFPIVFQQERGWSPGIGGLGYLGLLAGNFQWNLHQPVVEQELCEEM
ncbi:MFS general substrate transporter [Atractiella rhizophila]|nr:MFS general substrate transporter [Atractiella rhizophila]